MNHMTGCGDSMLSRAAPGVITKLAQSHKLTEIQRFRSLHYQPIWFAKQACAICSCVDIGNALAMYT